MKFAKSLVTAAALASVMATAATAQAGNADKRDLSWGTSAAPVSTPKTAAVAAINKPKGGSVGALSSATTYSDASFASGGVALRNRSNGVIQINGASGPVQAAWIYWAVITQGAPKAPDQSVQLSSFFPTTTPVQTIAGTAIGTGATPCWLGDRITVYRGSVPTSMFTAGGGNGLFKLTLLAKASGIGTQANGDPFFALSNGQPNSPLPEMEGASLVVVGTGNNSVAIFDSGLAGQEFVASDGLAYQLTLPVSASDSPQVLFDEIGADGQMYASDAPNNATANKLTSINSVPIAGTGASDIVPDWDGLAGSPIPQLWDDTLHDITAAATGSTLSVQISSPASADCIVTVANVVSVAPAP